MSVSQALTTATTAAELEVGRPTIDRTAPSFAGPIQEVGRGIMYAVVVLIVLGALYNTKIVANPDNPNAWTNLTATFADYGTTAFIMIGLGFIALGAAVALSYLGAFGDGNGGR